MGGVYRHPKDSNQPPQGHMAKKDTTVARTIVAGSPTQKWQTLPPPCPSMPIPHLFFCQKNVESFGHFSGEFLFEHAGKIESFEYFVQNHPGGVLFLRLSRSRIPVLKQRKRCVPPSPCFCSSRPSHQTFILFPTPAPGFSSSVDIGRTEGTFEKTLN